MAFVSRVSWGAYGDVGIVDVRRVSGVWFVWVGRIPACAATAALTSLFILAPRAICLGPIWLPVLHTYVDGIRSSNRPLFTLCCLRGAG
jgi:hypothetical protein